MIVSSIMFVYIVHIADFAVIQDVEDNELPLEEDEADKASTNDMLQALVNGKILVFH